MFQELNDKIKQLTGEAEQRQSLNVAIETANELLRILDPQADDLRTGEDALDDAIPVNQFPNQKVENWFMNHPYFTGDKVALRFYSSDKVETKFYWLGDSATKARVSAGVMLTPNWEDSELTRNDSYKIGIDFFLTANTKSLLVAISNNGNLRLLELADKLSHTQIEILQKLRGALALSTKEQIHKTLWDALALSEVNKKFYAGIAEQFNILLNHLIAEGKDKEDSKLFASRLFGRLLFIWFLRKKNIILEQFGYFELDGNDSTAYYNIKLKKLFFNTLNRPPGERHGEDDKTPYLNGGLFEAHENDWANQTVNFPTGFFNGLFEHLEKYNFTTDESSPEYEQVAIDPEMLGRVFESLLATQLTETGEQARKAKGAFYTPREIVSYMCRESLRQYLYTKLDNSAWNAGIDKLLDLPDAEWELAHSNAKRDLWGEANRNVVPLQVIGALNDLTVLDPACGSGAFPMGMLQLVLKTYERLDPTYDPYKKKLQIIQNTLFGVDIEPMAVEISRLRAWLSLIVEEEDSRGLEPLPNLDFKFICADSLIQLEQLEQTAIFSDPTLHEKLSDLRAKFFNARKPDMKEKWRNEYYNLTRPGQQSLYADKRDTQLRSFDPFKNAQSAEFFDADYMFGVSNFDIVIANPPYVGEKGHKELFRRIQKDGLGEFYLGKMDLFYFFFHHALNLSKQHGITAFISTNYYPTATGAQKLRQDFKNRASIKQLINFNELKIFESALGQHNMITILERDGEDDATARIVMCKTKGTATPRLLSQILYGNSESAAYANIPQHELYYGAADYIRFPNTGSTSTGIDVILEKLAVSGKPLGQLCNVNQGILSGADTFTNKHYQTFTSIDAEPGEGIFVLNLEEPMDLDVFNSIHSSTKERDILRPFFKNSNIHKYICDTTPSKYIIYINKKTPIEKYPTTIKHLARFKKLISQKRETQTGRLPWYSLHWPRSESIFEKEKVVVPYRSKTNTFAYSDQPWYFRTDAYSIIPTKQTIDAKYLTGLLNSKLMLSWLYFRGKRKGETLELFYDPLTKIPVKVPDQNTRADITAIVDKIITHKKADPSANTTDLESEIDRLVYGIYGLTPDEIKTIEDLYK